MATDSKSVGAPKGPFTVKYLDSLKARDKRYEVVEPGRTNLRLLVEPSGVKTFYYVYKRDGRRRYVRLGRYAPGCELSDIRARARRLDDLRDTGADPRDALREERRRAATAATMKELANRYLTRYAKKRKRTWAEDERIIGKDILPEWEDRAVASIERADVRKLLEGIVARGAPVAANRTLACLRTMFNYAVDQDIIEHSPCTRIKMPAREKPRDRWLNDRELKAVWVGLLAMRKVRLGDDELRWSLPCLALALMLITGQRKGEIIGMRWSELDRENAWWTLPPERSKNGLEHRVPLSPLALEMIALIPKVKGASFVFPARKVDGHLRGTSVDHLVRDHRAKFTIDDETIEPFTPHDLRRTVATHLARLGVARLTISKILNHAEGGVTSTYDRHAYEQEKRQALEAWATHLRRAVGLPAIAKSEAAEEARP